MSPDCSFLRHELIKYDIHASVVSKVEILAYSRLSQQDKQSFAEYFDLITLHNTTTSIIEHATQLRQKKKMSLGDAIIASTALAYDMPIMTRNIADFAWINDLIIINPFDKY